MLNLLPAEHVWPEVTLNSLRKPYPFPRSKPAELLSLRKALNRLTQGERDGKEMAPEEAIAFLRSRIELAAQQLAGKAKGFTPHLTTWLNQSRYLRSGAVLLADPQKTGDAMRILSAFPWRTGMPRNTEHLAPLLADIERGIEELRVIHGDAAPAWMLRQVQKFAQIVAAMSDEARQWMPGARKFFEEQKWRLDDRHWDRRPAVGYQSERAQMARVN